MRELDVTTNRSTLWVSRHANTLESMVGVKSDIDLLRDHAQTRKQHKNKRILSKSCVGTGKFVFPQKVTRSSTCCATVGTVVVCHVICMFRKLTLMSILPMVHEGVRQCDVLRHVMQVHLNLHLSQPLTLPRPLGLVLARLRLVTS